MSAKQKIYVNWVSCIKEWEVFAPQFPHANWSFKKIKKKKNHISVTLTL